MKLAFLTPPMTGECNVITVMHYFVAPYTAKKHILLNVKLLL